MKSIFHYSQLAIALFPILIAYTEKWQNSAQIRPLFSNHFSESCLENRNAHICQNSPRSRSKEKPNVNLKRTSNQDEEYNYHAIYQADGNGAHVRASGVFKEKTIKVSESGSGAIFISLKDIVFDRFDIKAASGINKAAFALQIAEAYREPIYFNNNGNAISTDETSQRGNPDKLMATGEDQMDVIRTLLFLPPLPQKPVRVGDAYEVSWQLVQGSQASVKISVKVLEITKSRRQEVVKIKINSTWTTGLSVPDKILCEGTGFIDTHSGRYLRINLVHTAESIFFNKESWNLVTMKNTKRSSKDNCSIVF